MRKLVLGAALAALLAIFVTAPALAAGPARVSGNEVLIAKALAARGIIPKGATKAQAMAIVRAYIQQKAGNKPETLPVKIAPRFLNGEYAGFGTNEHGMWNVHDGVGTDKALVVLVDFSGPWRGDMGPLHGQIPAPGAMDNSTFWPGDFSTQHYQDMLFGDSFPVYNADGSLKGVSDDTFAEYYLEQSHDTYTVTGDISDWVTRPYPESYYGRIGEGEGSDNANGPLWRVVEDAIRGLAAREPDFPWADYDHENPWGIVPGGIEQPGRLHRPPDPRARRRRPVGRRRRPGRRRHLGVIVVGARLLDSRPGRQPRLPSGSDLWVGPYTINPEDGGIGVFSHEFGHDLGLPDQYNYIGAVDAMPQYWTLMDRGSWLGSPEFGLDTRPSDMDAWSKYYLGWVDPVVVPRGATANVKLEPAATGAADKTTAVIELPDQAYATISGATVILVVVLRHGRQPEQPAHQRRDDRRAGESPGADLQHLVRHRDRVRLRHGRRLDRRFGLDLPGGQPHRGGLPRDLRHHGHQPGLAGGQVRSLGVGRQVGVPALPLRHRRRRVAKGLGGSTTSP